MQGELILRQRTDPLAGRGETDDCKWCDTIKYLEKQFIR